MAAAAVDRSGPDSDGPGAGRRGREDGRREGGFCICPSLLTSKRIREEKEKGGRAADFSCKSPSYGGNQPPFRTVLVELRMGWNFIIGLVYIHGIFHLTKMMRDETINKGPITIASSSATAWRGWTHRRRSMERRGQGRGQSRGKEANEMVCCQPSGKNDPEQIAASFPRQGGAEGEGGGRRASERTDFPHSAYDIRRPRPPSLALPPLPMTALVRSPPRPPRGARDQNIVACFMGSLIARRMSGWVSRGVSRL